MLTLYAHPFSSYCWKVLTAFWETGVAFDYRNIEEGDNGAEWARLWPLRKMPLLVDDGRVVQETAIIIEHVQLHHGGTHALIPPDPIEALEVRRLDFLSDNYLMDPMGRIVADRIRPEDKRDAEMVGKDRALLGQALDWWEAHIAAQVAAGHDWAWDRFSLADCAAMPALFYIDWVQPFAESHPALHAYRARLMARPSMTRAIDEARPYRHYFPFGDPGRD